MSEKEQHGAEKAAAAAGDQTELIPAIPGAVDPEPTETGTAEADVEEPGAAEPESAEAVVADDTAEPVADGVEPVESALAEDLAKSGPEIPELATDQLGSVEPVAVEQPTVADTAELEDSGPAPAEELVEADSAEPATAEPDPAGLDVAESVGAEDTVNTDSDAPAASDELPDYLRTQPVPIVTVDEPGQGEAPAPVEEPAQPEAPAEGVGLGAVTRTSVLGRVAEEAGSSPEPTESPEPIGDAAPAVPAEVIEPPLVSVAAGTPSFDDVVATPTEGANVPKQNPKAAPTRGKPVPAKDKSAPSKVKRVLLGVLGAVVVLGGAYVGAAWYFGDKVPTDTIVAGVDLSGLDRTDAVSALMAGLDDQLNSDISVSLADAASQVNPKEAGLVFNVDATVDQVIGFSLEPARVFAHLLGGGVHDPIVSVDATTMHSALAGIATDLDIAPVEGELTIVDGKIESTDPEDGLGVDIDPAVDVVTKEWLGGARPVVLPSTTLTPTIDADVMAKAQTTILDPLFFGPLALAINDFTAEIPVSDLTEAASLRPVDGGFELLLDPEKITGVVSELMPELGTSPKPAQIKITGGVPTITPSVTGAGIDPDELAQVLAVAAVKTGEARQASLELATTEPDFTTKDAEALKVVERVSQFSTPVPYDPIRTKNLVNGAAKLNGILVKPGETFSLIAALGPITRANGYFSSGVVVNGFESEAIGGGLSQMSTTAFNAAFEAGMEDVSHTPHSRWFSRYPEGREATMFEPNLDMKWRNNTPYGVVVHSWIDDRAHVSLWSTKYWDTKITTGSRTRFTPSQTVYNTSTNCTPESGGSSGFTVSVQRIVSLDGVRSDEFSRSYTHTYQPWNHVVCGKKPTAAELKAAKDD